MKTIIANRQRAASVPYFLILAGWLAVPAFALAEEAAVEVRFIPISSPTGELVNRVRTVTGKEWEQFKRLQQQQPQARQLKLVFDFNHDSGPNHSDRNNYGVCRDLARCIQELRQHGVETYAFVHGRVTGHSVLPVLACSKIIMSGDARLGPVVEPGGAEPEDDVKVAYRQLSAHRPSPVLIEKFVELRLSVVESRKGGWVSREAADANPEAGAELFRSGVYAEYDWKKARRCDLCEQDRIESRDELVRRYGWPRSSLQGHALLGDKVVAGHVEVKGPVTMELYEDLQRRVNAATADKVNLLVLELRCGGGNTADARRVAQYLRDLNTRNLDSPMQTVAWVTTDARDTALYLALACDLILMAPDAHLGDFADMVQGKNSEELRQAADALEKLAREQLYPAKLVRGMLDPGIRNLFLVRSNDGRSQDVLTGEEVDADRRAEMPRWNLVKEIEKGRGGLIVLTAAQAREFGLSRGEAADAEAVYKQYGLSKSSVRDYGDDWIDDLKRFLSNPWTSFFLVMIGITCLILELKMPGATLPGVIAAICFVLFFWSQTKVGAPVLWLAVLLFLLGLILLALEIFVLPGFGVCGISGMILTFGGLGLAAYGRWPQTKTQWLEFGNELAPYGLSLMGAILSAMALVRYLPNIPVLNRLFLTPEPEVADGPLPGAPVYPELTGLLGAIGVSATPLRPAGKVQFGEQFVDVVAEGGYVVPGTRVQVVEIEGNRVVVKEV